jgi:5-formyltetrahydrofolate cyclo-ligase
VSQSQKEIRQAARNARAALSNEERDVRSGLIREKVISASWFRRAEYIACYLPSADEVNTWEIISRAWVMKKRVFVPVIGKNSYMQFQEITAETELRRNRFGLFEPNDGEIVSTRMLDVVLAPLVAFDDNNNRVGMGGGYFDRTFSFLRHRDAWTRPKIIGLAFSCQKVEKIPPNPWDIRLFCAVTDR